ncbi:hypothetical protein HY968_03115 [Candidatus Kaiserbacteria bacterium]|nr:hypothetical protein [Candidatus Kaiserbacteria bacterium]
MKVYLDTNILIRGASDPEHDELKKLVKEGKISLFNSYHGDIEQHGRVFPARRKRDRTMRDLYKSAEKFAEFKKADEEYEAALAAESTEQDYWAEAHVYPTMSTFDSLVPYHHLGIIPDFKNEMPLFQELVEAHKFGPGDAFHVMSAHSSVMDYLLTWDKKSFINKCKKVNWLKPKIMTPKDFLQNVKS